MIQDNIKMNLQILRNKRKKFYKDQKNHIIIIHNIKIRQKMMNNN